MSDNTIALACYWLIQVFTPGQLLTDSEPHTPDAPRCVRKDGTVLAHSFCLSARLKRGSEDTNLGTWTLQPNLSLSSPQTQ